MMLRIISLFTLKIIPKYINYPYDLAMVQFS